MKLDKKKAALSAIAISAVASGSLLFAAQSFAQGTANAPGFLGQDLAQQFADHFHLNVDDVKSFLQQLRTDRQQQMQDRFQQRLDQAVTDGKLTEDQKALILQKEEEMKSFFDSIKDLSPQDRQTQIRDKQKELKDWAQQNNIDLRFLMGGEPLMGRGFRFGHRGGHFGPGQGPNNGQQQPAQQ